MLDKVPLYAPVPASAEDPHVALVGIEVRAYYEMACIVGHHHPGDGVPPPRPTRKGSLPDCFAAQSVIGVITVAVTLLDSGSMAISWLE